MLNQIKLVLLTLTRNMHSTAAMIESISNLLFMTLIQKTISIASTWYILGRFKIDRQRKQRAVSGLICGQVLHKNLSQLRAQEASLSQYDMSNLTVESCWHAAVAANRIPTDRAESQERREFDRFARTIAAANQRCQSRATQRRAQERDSEKLWKMWKYLKTMRVLSWFVFQEIAEHMTTAQNSHTTSIQL